MTAMMAFWVAVVSLVFGAVCSTLHLSLRGLSRSRIDQLAERYQQLKSENRELRERVAAVEADNRRLRDKVEIAAARVEAVLEQLPQA